MLVTMTCSKCGMTRHTDCSFERKCDYCNTKTMVVREKSMWVGTGDLAYHVYERFDENGKQLDFKSGKVDEAPRKTRAKKSYKAHESYESLSAHEPVANHEAGIDWVDPMESVKKDIEQMAE